MTLPDTTARKQGFYLIFQYLIGIMGCGGAAVNNWGFRQKENAPSGAFSIF
jgi:hypothetical protein